VILVVAGLIAAGLIEASVKSWLWRQIEHIETGL
jgi:hypothetical protein